jgi:hypothetical protein
MCHDISAHQIALACFQQSVTVGYAMKEKGEEESSPCGHDVKLYSKKIF